MKRKRGRDEYELMLLVLGVFGALGMPVIILLLGRA